MEARTLPASCLPRDAWLPPPPAGPCSLILGMSGEVGPAPVLVPLRGQGTPTASLSTAPLPLGPAGPWVLGGVGMWPPLQAPGAAPSQVQPPSHAWEGAFGLHSFRHTDSFTRFILRSLEALRCPGVHFFSQSDRGLCTDLFQSLVPLPLPSAMTHIFLLGSWGQEGKLLGLPPLSFSPTGGYS